MIPPEVQRFIAKRASSTVVEVAGSHAIHVSQPKAVAAFIEKATRGSESICTPAWPTPTCSIRPADS
jgi:hypothetical protein